MGSKITVVGSANMDMVIRCHRMPRLGETLAGSGYRTNPGGKGLNQAVAVARLGGQVSFLGALGLDANGEALLQCMNTSGVAFEGLRLQDAPTGIAMIAVVDGDNFIILDSGANTCLTPEMVRAHADVIAGSEYCILQLEIPLETVLAVCRIAKENGTKVVLNPAPFHALPESIFPMVDYLIPNEHEALDMTGICPDREETCREAIRRLLEMGVKNVIITLGERGCAFNNGQEIVFHPAEKVNVVDTTSAGDCFIGALTVKLAQGSPLQEAVSFAVKASALAVSREGASCSIPTAEEVK